MKKTKNMTINLTLLFCHISLIKHAKQKQMGSQIFWLNKQIVPFYKISLNHSEFKPFRWMTIYLLSSKQLVSMQLDPSFKTTFFVPNGP